MTAVRIYAVLSILGGWAFAEIAVAIARSRKPYSLPGRNEVIAIAIGVAGVIHAVLLTFLVTVVWQRWADASSVAENEAGDALTICRLALRFPPSARDPIVSATSRYGRCVVNEEWPEIPRMGQRARCTGELHAIWRAALEANVTTPAEGGVYAELLRSIASLSESRRHRLISTRTVIPPILWIFMLAGSVSLVIAMSLVQTVHRLTHRSMVAMISVTLSFLMFIIATLDHPYAGGLGVHPDAFDSVLEVLQTRDLDGALARPLPPAR